MNLLLDTCTFIWMAEDSSRLSESARAVLSDPDNRIVVSSITYWEVVHKYKLGKLALVMPPPTFFERVTEAMDVEIEDFSTQDALALESLTCHHRDPFDLMLICQAKNRDLVLVTPDPLIHQYEISVLW